MPYTQEISRETPGAFIFLVDQSLSMNETFVLDSDGDPIPRAVYVANALNNTLDELVSSCLGADGIRDYFDIGVVGYGKTGKTRFCWRGKLAGRKMVPIAEVAEHATLVTTLIDRGGDVRETEAHATWVDPAAWGLTPMKRALNIARDTLQTWIEHHPDSFPPIVINITDGVATDIESYDDLWLAAEEVTSLATTDGNVLLFNCHIQGEHRQSLMFPSDPYQLPPDEHANVLFQMSSELRGRQHAAICEIFDRDMHASESVRCMSYNADASTLIRLLDIGTTGAFTVPELGASAPKEDHEHWNQYKEMIWPEFSNSLEGDHPPMKPVLTKKKAAQKKKKGPSKSLFASVLDGIFGPPKPSKPRPAKAKAEPPKAAAKPAGKPPAVRKKPGKSKSLFGALLDGIFGPPKPSKLKGKGKPGVVVTPPPRPEEELSEFGETNIIDVIADPAAAPLKAADDASVSEPYIWPKHREILEEAGIDVPANRGDDVDWKHEYEDDLETYGLDPEKAEEIRRVQESIMAAREEPPEDDYEAQADRAATQYLEDPKVQESVKDILTSLKSPASVQSQQNFDVMLIQDEGSADPVKAGLIRAVFPANRKLFSFRPIKGLLRALRFMKPQRGGNTVDKRPDLILLDVDDPGMDGLDFLSQLNADPLLRAVPIVVLSSSEDEEFVVACYDRGASGFVVKPDNDAAFIDTVKNIGNYWNGVVRLPWKKKPGVD